MTEEPFSLSTTSETLLSLPVSDARPEGDRAEIGEFSQAFYAEARKADANGLGTISTAWKLLGQICQISLQESEPDEPFGPTLRSPEGRSLVPSDLDNGSADAVRQLALRVDNPELCARLSDVAWDRLRDPAMARLAVQSYMDAASHLYDPANWVAYAVRIERAVRLARQLGDQGLLDSIVMKIDQLIIELDGADPLYLTCRLMELLCEFRAGDPDIMADIAQRAAGSAAAAKDYERARSHLENVLRWRRRAKDDAGERNARIAIAESYISQADLHSGPGGELNVVHWLEQAHEAYRAIGGTRDKTAEIYVRLREAQRRARNAMQEIRSEGIDVTPLIKAARERVSNKPFKEALLAFATVTRPTNFEQQSKHTRELMAKFPLQHILGGMKIDNDGRIVARRTAALTSDENETQQALWERVVEQVVMNYQLIVQAEIIPAINQLMFEHSPTLRDLRDLVVNNPFVLVGHEELFAKGILAGLRWNFPEALSILVPQLENSLRHMLARIGRETTTRNKHGLQTVAPLGTILSDPQGHLESILGPDIIKELRVLFTDQHGADLRNDIAHGLISHGEFFSPAAIYAWWFILFLCINPVYRRFQTETGLSGTGSDPANRDQSDPNG